MAINTYKANSFRLKILANLAHLKRNTASDFNWVKIYFSLNSESSKS